MFLLGEKRRSYAATGANVKLREGTQGVVTGLIGGIALFGEHRFPM